MQSAPLPPVIVDWVLRPSTSVFVEPDTVYELLLTRATALNPAMRAAPHAAGASCCAVAGPTMRVAALRTPVTPIEFACAVSPVELTTLAITATAAAQTSTLRITTHPARTRGQTRDSRLSPG